MTEIEDKKLESAFGVCEHAECNTELKENVGSSGSVLGEAALSYAAKGWPVLPLRPGEKTPLTVNGSKDASTDGLSSCKTS